MRVLVKVSMPTEFVNSKFKDGSFGPTMKKILGELKPETAYFYEENGERTGLVVINMDKPSQIPAVAEPFFLAFNAKVEFHPAMRPEDLEEAGPAIESAVRNYG